MVFADSCHWRACFGGAGRKFPWEPEGCLWRHTETQSCSSGCPDRYVSLFITSTLRLSSLLSVSGACLCFPLVITNSSHREHTSWNEFPHTGHYHVMKECYDRLDLFAPTFIKAKGRKGDRHRQYVCCCSRYTAQVMAIWKSPFSNSPSLVLLPADNCTKYKWSYIWHNRWTQNTTPHSVYRDTSPGEYIRYTVLYAVMFTCSNNFFQLLL